MCGIAGIVDLRQRRPVDPLALARMTAALQHRGPDEGGSYLEKGVGLASRRLRIVDLRDSQQPMFNEDRSVAVVFNGELFDYVERREELAGRGHQLSTAGDTETLVHLWEDHGEQMFDHVNGQFAFALYDQRERVLILARDRVGICPLHWARVGDWLVFGSETKALFSSGMVRPVADPQGLNHILTFFCMPGRRTVFDQVRSVAPGCYLKIRLRGDGEVASIQEHSYWDFEFPQQGEEHDPQDESELVDQLDDVLQRAIRLRMQADVPVGAYLSGGVDSALILSAARQLGCPPRKTFTAAVGDPRLNEAAQAATIARTLGCDHRVIHCDARRLSSVFPRMIQAADSPVVDPNSGALFGLSRAVHQDGLKVVLTGEGADEALAGYVWFKVHKLSRLASCAGWSPAFAAFALAFRLGFSRAPHQEFSRINRSVGGMHAQTLLYHLTSVARWRLLNPEFAQLLNGHRAYDDLQLDTARIRRWHPLNQSLYFGYKTHLVGLLLNHRGDRALMANSVEARYPFLDEGVISLCNRIHPRWKLRGLRQDKYLLRRLAIRYVPQRIALRPKAMFRAPFKETFFPSSQPYVGQLLSPSSLQATPYFDVDCVRRLYRRYQSVRRYQLPHQLFDEIALVAVLATQMWHHLYLGGELCELPTWSVPTVDPAAASCAAAV